MGVCWQVCSTTGHRLKQCPSCHSSWYRTCFFVSFLHLKYTTLHSRKQISLKGGFLGIHIMCILCYSHSIVCWVHDLKPFRTFAGEIDPTKTLRPDTPKIFADRYDLNAKPKRAKSRCHILLDSYPQKGRLGSPVFRVYCSLLTWCKSLSAERPCLHLLQTEMGPFSKFQKS